MHRFYSSEVAVCHWLPEDESAHCARVLRMVEGDLIEVVDGRGLCHTCRLAAVNAKRCLVDIVSTVSMPPHWGHHVTVAVAPPKRSERMEWAVEKCAEMGVDRIVPLLCRHSERRQFRSARIEALLVAAMKQSLKATLPHLDGLTPLSAFLAEPSSGEQRFIAYCDPSLPLHQRCTLASAYRPGSDVTILIGPEGDFSEDEVAAALRAGYTPVTFGQSRLRTETAAVVACATIHALDQVAQSNSNPPVNE